MSDVNREALMAEAERLEREAANLAGGDNREAWSNAVFARDAFWKLHRVSLLSLLHADAAKVQELTAEVDRVKALLGKEALANHNTRMEMRQQIWDLKADRDRLTAEVKRLKGHKCHSCSLGCEKVCKADLAGCPSECLSLPYRRHLNMTQRAEKAGADVTRLTAQVRELDMALASWKEWGFKQTNVTAQWESLKAWHREYADKAAETGTETAEGISLAHAASIDHMAELEAQR